ncbi:MAG: tetratricopeptide repeat protein [Archangium sp.]|nr:tetratricopeptide repeat protein [Archangium sp.]
MSMLSFAVAVALGQAGDPDALKRTIAVEAANVEKAPDDTDALYRLGLAYLSLGEAKKAVRPLEALVKKDAESIDAKLLLARAYRISNEPAKAKDVLDRAILSMPDEVSFRAERALLARSLEEISDAITHYQKAVELTPANAELIFNLAEAQQKNGQLDSAISGYRRAIELNPDLSGARVNLGKALAEKGLFGEAKEVLSGVTKSTLADAEAHYNLGVIYMRESNVSNAITEFERTLAITPKHAQALNNLGVAWDARADAKKALDYFKKATLADPTFTEAYFNQGMSLMQLNRQQEATKAFEQALKLEPASSSPYVQLGTLYLKQSKKDRAVEAFKKAIELLDAEEKDTSKFLQLKKRFVAGRTTDAYRGLALAYLSLGKVEEAVGTLKAAVDKMPKDPAARLALGEAYIAQGNFDGAVEQLKERLALEKTTDAKLDLARAYVKQRVAKQAEPLYKEVLAEEPTNRAAKMGLVDLYTAMGKYGDAELLLKDAMTNDANDANALMRFGIMKSRMQRPDQALEALERAVQLNPSLTEARAELAFLLFRGDPENADRCVATMSDILTSEPRNALALNYLGVCHYAKGNKPRAEEAFKAAISADTSFATAYFSLAQLYENDGKKDEAKKNYDTAAKLGMAEAAAALKALTGGK